MLDRASAVDEQFIKKVSLGHFPTSTSSLSLFDVGLDKKYVLDLFDSQLKSRHLDLIARALKEKGLAFYTIGSSGHEGNAVFGQVFRASDMAFLHYRSGAFYIQRAKQQSGCDGVHDILLSLVAAASDPISGGRHKVFGSVPLLIPPQTSTIASHAPKALGAAISISKAKELDLSSPLPADSIVLCSFGDASVNHASIQTTLNACAWLATQSYPLPLIFICEDNGLGISVPTPVHWIQTSVQNRPGIHYIACDGLNIADIYQKACQAEYIARVKKQPVFLHMHCVRLLGHAGSDIESQYRSEEQIAQTEADDPLLHTAGLLYRAGYIDLEAILNHYDTIRREIKEQSQIVIQAPKLASAEAIMSCITPINVPKISHVLPNENSRQETFGTHYAQLEMKRNLCQQINFALTDLLLQYSNMLVFGEDVGKKGGVYRVTADLQSRFGQKRVFDTLLDETTILGTAIGMAHNGFLPVPEIQFLAYLHNAEDQLRGEAATLSFFSKGQYRNPMVIRIAALAYQKGFGGHFHNDNSIAVLRDLPGVIVACPSNGPSAAKLLRRCMALAQEEGRIVVFLEPIALYMTKDLYQEGDNGWLFNYPSPGAMLSLGEVGVYGQGDTVIISYGNGYYLARQAEKILRETHHIQTKLIDLNWLSPLPMASILREIKGAKQVLIVDEGRRSGSLSEGLITALMEQAPSSLKIARLTGEDCFIPLGTAWQHLLPSRDKIIDAVLALIQKEHGHG